MKRREYAHLRCLWCLIVYLILFALTERFIPAEKCRVVWMPIDDKIPFCEYFVIAYVFWYVLSLGSLVWFALRSPEGFKRLVCFIGVVGLVSAAIYILFPSRQELRPEAFPRDNVFSRLLGLIYCIDTNTGVCPSMHVSVSLALASAWLKERGVSPWWKIFVALSCLLICMSVVFVKQHSVADILAALPLCLLAEIAAYGKDRWIPGLRKTA